MSYLLAILGLALLMVVHEGGHFLAARRHGMRVTRFSIGFGPRLFEHQPKGSETRSRSSPSSRSCRSTA